MSPPGRAATSRPGRASTRRRLIGVTALLLPMALGGCGSVGAVAGAVAGGSTGVATANPVVGYAVAVGVNAGVDDLQKYVARVRQGAEQDAIVEAVGRMPPGQTVPWRIVHDIPMFDDEHGEMEVVRLIETPLAPCKEVLFTVDRGAGTRLRRRAYATDACLGSAGWKWAEAEPSTERWGYFQRISH